MGYHKREGVIDAFLASGAKRMRLDWYTMGYSNAKTCRSSFASLIRALGSPVFCEQRNNQVFLVRPDGYAVNGKFEPTSDDPTFSVRTIDTKNHVESLLKKFITSDLWVYQLLWDRLGYMSADSCYTSYRTSIAAYGFNKQMFVVKRREEVFLIRRPDPPTEETKLEEHWEEEISM